MKTQKFCTIIVLYFLSLSVFAQSWDMVKHITGPGNIDLRVLTTDGSNNIYAGGEFANTINFVGSSLSLTATGSTDGFIGKISNGNWEWALKIGSSTAVQLRNIAFDKNGDVYATGTFTGTTTFESLDPLDNVSLISTGGQDSYLAKYDSDGNLIFAWHIAKSSSDNRIFGVFIDHDLNIYMSGFWLGGNLELDSETALSFLGSTDNWGNSFIIKLNSLGDLIWHTHISGISNTVGGGAVRASGGIINSTGDGVYVYINYRGTIRVQNSNPLIEITGAGVQSTAVFKINANGVVDWLRKMTNSSQVTTGNFITTDETSAVYLVGSFNTPATFSNGEGDPITLTTKGAYDAFLAKYNSNGSLGWAKNMGGIQDDKTWSVKHSNDAVSAVGFFKSTMYIGNTPQTQDTLISKGANDLLVLKYDKEGNYLSSASLGGSADEEGIDLIYDNEGNILVGGYFLSSTIDIGATQLMNGGNRDVFIAKLIDINIVPTLTPVSCFGGSDGELGFSVSGGGTAPYTYSVYLGVDEIASGIYSTPVSLSGLAAGTYKITATDANLKSKVKYVQITQPNQLTASINVTNITTCYGATTGNITITGAAGGYGTYEYSITGGTNWQTSNVFNNIVAGTYHVMIRDAAYPSCARTLNETTVITQPTEIIIMPMPTNITCNGAANGKIEISVTGGSGTYQYSINGGETYFATNIFTGLTGGAYSIYVNDGTCQKFGGIVSIIDPDEITADQILFEPLTCFGANDGSITVNMVSGGSGSYEYSINGVNFFESNVFTGLGPGDYDVFIKDTYGCTVQVGTISIIEPNPISIVTVVPQNITGCFGALAGEITITATGGTGTLSYSINDGADWQAGSGVFTGIAAGSYIVKVKDVNDCETTWASNPVVITQPAEIVIGDVIEESISCSGLTDGKITVTASGGTGTLEYSINGTDYQASNVFENLAKNTYNVFVKDENGCIVQWGFDVVINEPLELGYSSLVINRENLPGTYGSIIITASGGTGPYTYTLTPGDISNQTGQFTGLMGGNYTIQIVDFNGCTFTTSTLTVSIDEIEPGIKDGLKIYPNPSTGQFFVEFNNQLNKELFIRIFNVVGQVVYTYKVDPLDTFVKKEINLENEAKGVYMIQITGPDSKLTKKLIIR